MKSFWVALVGATVLALASTGAQAGSGNVLYLSQDADTGIDNSFTSDQVGASYSVIGEPWKPASQVGHGNEASLTLTSQCAASSDPLCGTVQLTQVNSAAGASSFSPALARLFQTPLDANTAVVTLTGEGNAAILQIGGANNASLAVDDGQGAISQIGLNNSADLTLYGDANGSVSQTGVGHVASLQVTAVNGGTVALTQVGAARNYQQPVTVATTGTVYITQFGF